MKHTLFTRKAMALLLALAMVLGAVGCGKADNAASAPAQNDGGVAQSGASETAQPTQGVSADESGAKSLAQLRAQALQENEYAAFAVAYLDGTDINDIGYSYTENGTVHGNRFIENIDDAHRIDVADGTREAEVYCLLPIDPNAGMVVSLVDEQTNDVIKEVYRSETGEPILLCCNGEGVPNAKVSFAYDGGMADFWPMMQMHNGEKYMVLPNGDVCYDFTTYPNWEDVRKAYLPAGNWRAEVQEPRLASQRLVMMLYLFPQDGEANMSISELASGDYMAGYGGSWALTDDGLMALDLHCNENHTGLAAYDAPIKGNYPFTIGEDEGMTLTLADKQSTPLYGNHANEPITFYAEISGTHPSQYGYELCAAVLNWCESTQGFRPDSARVERESEGEPLIHVYDDMGNYTLDCGWYTINPDTLQGHNYNTGETIDFSEYADGAKYRTN